MKKEKRNYKGFTLLEMLVVVLIIGILAGIALPQYSKAVEKAKLAEVLINIKAIEDSVNRYLLANGFPNERVCLRDILDIDLQSGEWNDTGLQYQINEQNYIGNCSQDGCFVGVRDKDDPYSSAILEIQILSDGKNAGCFANEIEKGRLICKYLESLGWEYYDGEY